MRCISYILSICCKCVASTLQVNQILAFFFNFHKRKTPAIARVLNLFESRNSIIEIISLVIEINALIVETLEKQGFSKAMLQVCCKPETFHIGS